MESSLQEIIHRLNCHPSINTNWRNKFYQSIVDTANGVKLENYYNTHKSKFTNFNQYKSFRIHSSAIPLCLRFIELYNSNRGTRDDSNNCISYNYDIATISSMDNDLLSHQKEETCTVLDLMNKTDVQILRNRMMKNLMVKHRLDTDYGDIYKKQLIVFAEGLIRFQLNAKKRYIHGLNVLFNSNENVNEYEYDNSMVNLYTPNTLNIDFKEYDIKYKATLQNITNNSYEFAVRHNLLQDGTMKEIWNNLDIGHFCYAYSFITPHCEENLYLLQIISDFVGWVFMVDDIWEFCDDNAPFDFYKNVTYQI